MPTEAWKNPNRRTEGGLAALVLVSGRGLVPPLSQTVHRTIMVVDVADFTNPSRNVADLMAVQEGVYDVLKTAFTEAGVDYGSCEAEDRGDGALILIPPDISKSMLVDRLPERLIAALRRHNATRTEAARFKLRVGIHAGDIRWNAPGWVGHAVNEASRIVEVAEVKSALAQSDGLLALIVSDHFYTEVIKQDPGVAPEEYLRIQASVKTFSGVIWLRLPGATRTGSILPSASPNSVDPPPTTEDQITPEGGVLGVVPREALETLRGWLSDRQVPHLATLVARAVGPAIPPPLASSAWDVFRYLADYNAGPDGIPPALAYLKLLAGEIGGEFEASVSDVVDQQIRRLRLATVMAERQATWRPIPAEPHLHLMIVIEPDAIDPQRCLLSSWRQDDPLVWPPPRGDVRETTIDELEYQVDEVILAAERSWADQTASVLIEFVLARSLLTLPVRRWRKEHHSGEPRPLALDYDLGVRSLERMRRTYWHRQWKVRWESLVRHPGLDRVHPFGPRMAEDGIDAVLSDPRWVGLVMEQPPPSQPRPDAGPDALTAALRAGLPFICWHSTVGPEDLRTQVDWLLGGTRGLVDLPQRRRAALMSAQHNDVVYDLVVMWEDPYRIIDLDQGPMIPQ
jgi:class 3 adenylate cyclase